MKVLAVDDNAHNRYLIEVLFKTRGDEVVSAANGIEALEKLRQDHIDLIVSDILMPRMDGYRLCRECKRDDELKNIPFVFATSTYTDEKDEAFALSLGADAFIRRPIEADAFLRIVDAVAAGQRLPSPAIAGGDETRYWAGYVDRLVDKLEKKIADLETEIAARGRAEEALRESDERYRSLVAALFEGVVLFDGDGAIRACNASAERMLGLTPGAMRARALFDPPSPPIHEDGSPFSRETYPPAVTLTTGKPCHNVIMGFRKTDGTLRWLSVNSQPLRRPDAARPYAVVASFVDITEQKQLEQELERQARTDSLTGAINRRHFMDLAEQEMVVSRRYRHPLSLLMLDIDCFKAVNDTYGHHAGDVALQTLVHVCRRALRDVDVLARLGGEEFGILLPETAIDRAVRVAERVRQAVAACEIPVDDQPPVRFTISLGVATLCDVDADIDALLRRADRALYDAKQAGRNQVRVAAAPAEAAPAGRVRRPEGAS